MADQVTCWVQNFTVKMTGQGHKRAQFAPDTTKQDTFAVGKCRKGIYHGRRIK